KLTMDTLLGRADIIDLNIKITSSKFVRFILSSADGGAIYYTLESNGFFKIPCELGYQTSLIRSDGEMALMNFGDSSFLRKKGQVIYTNGKIKELVPVVILRNTNYFRINSRLQTEQKIIAHNADKLYLVEGKKVSLLKTEFGAKLLTIDKLNRIWIYTNQDILLCCQLDKNNVIKVLKKNTLSKNNPLIYLKMIDSCILMIDSKGGISIIDHNDKIKQLCQNNAFMLTRDVISLNNDILIGTYGMGLFLCSKGQVRQLPLDNRKSLTYINCFNRNGDVLEISTNNGLFELHLQLIEKFKNGTFQQIPYLDIGKSTSANLLDIEFNGGCFPCYTKYLDYSAYPTAIGVLLNKKNKSLTHIEKPRFRISHVNGQSVNNKFLINLDGYTNDTKINILTSYHGNYNNLYADLSINNMTSKIDNKLLFGNQIEITGLKSGINICKIKIYNQKWIYESSFIVYVPNLWYKEIKYQILLFTSILIIIWSFKNYRIKNLVNKNKKLDFIIHEKSKDLKENLVLLEEKNHELKREIELKSNVVTLINHDILGPLRFTSLVINELAQENNDHNSEKLKQISNSINGMYTNSHGLLNWLLINSNRLEPRYTELNLEDFLTERCDYYQALIYNTTISKYFLNKTILIKADTNILTSCINNLIENASKYKNENDVSVRIVSQTELKIVISNAVKNFPKKLIKTINNKPELLIGKIKYKEGVGLGLSIYLLNLMQWRLKVNVNKGRVYFVIYIPT
ncbi:MAG TPA: ATP-binding protein, partial [Bacteroidia bacterium]